jgi:hypothetical protein
VEYRINKSKLSLQRLSGFLLVLGGGVGLLGPVFNELSAIPESEPALSLLGKAALLSWPYWIMLIAGLGFLADGLTAETVRLDGDHLILLRRTMGITSGRKFEIAGLLDVRYLRGFSLGELAWDWMAFWYKGHDIRFGDGIGREEAERLLAWMQEARPEIFYERGEEDAPAGEAGTLQ